LSFQYSKSRIPRPSASFLEYTKNIRDASKPGGIKRIDTSMKENNTDKYSDLVVIRWGIIEIRSHGHSGEDHLR